MNLLSLISKQTLSFRYNMNRSETTLINSINCTDSKRQLRFQTMNNPFFLIFYIHILSNLIYDGLRTLVTKKLIYRRDLYLRDKKICSNSACSNHSAEQNTQSMFVGRVNSRVRVRSPIFNVERTSLGRGSDRSRGDCVIENRIFLFAILLVLYIIYIYYKRYNAEILYNYFTILSINKI